MCELNDYTIELADNQCYKHMEHFCNLQSYYMDLRYKAQLGIDIWQHDYCLRILHAAHIAHPRKQVDIQILQLLESFCTVHFQNIQRLSYIGFFALICNHFGPLDFQYTPVSIDIHCNRIKIVSN